MNNNLYINVGEILDLIECIETANNNPDVTETIQEVENVIHDMKWIELDQDEKALRNKPFKAYEMSQRIKKLFDDSKIPYVQIAKKLEIPRSLIYCYVDEQHIPGAEKIAKICKEFDVSADYLIFGE